MHAGPKGYPLIGNLMDYVRAPLGFMESVARTHGDIAEIQLAGTRFYLLSHPDLVESVLVTQNKRFIKGIPVRSGARLFGAGLLVSEHDFWLRQRRLAQPAFHPERISAYGQIMTSHTDRLLSQWRDGKVLDMSQAMLGLTMGVATQTLFNTDLTNVAAATIALDTALDWWNKTFTLPALLTALPTPGKLRFTRALKQLDQMVYDIIEKRRKSGEDPGDLLAMLMAARDDDGQRMTDKQLRDEVMTLFFAGHETTANALTWTFYLLTTYPEVEERLHAELQSVLNGRTPTMTDLRRLTYTHQVITEALRLFPPAWGTAWEAIEEVELGGYRFPRGTNFIVSQYVLHRDPRFYTNPDEFQPERWTDQFRQMLPAYAYFPFGGGPRICIGKEFAMMEAVLVMATIAQQYRAMLEPGTFEVVPEPLITLRPRDGLPMRLVRR